MRSITFISLLILGLGCTSTKNAATNSGQLNGTWVPIKEEIGKVSLPPGAFQRQQLIINDSLYTFSAESVDKGVVKYNGNKMDIYGKYGVNAGKHFTAIYKYGNEQLTVCYNLLGDSYPEAFETRGRPTIFLCLFKKK